MSSPATILVADDNGVNRFMLQQHVKQLGHKVHGVENGVRALQFLRQEPCDLLLLDLEMPELDGYGVLEQLKRDPRLRELPVIMVSGLDELPNVVRCIEQGAEDFLSKPFDPVLLRARINACLEKKRLRDEQQQKTAELEAALEQLRATQDQLVVQEKLASLGALTAGIAHEIKNPLNFVCNFADLSHSLLDELREELGETAAKESIDEVLETLKQNLGKILEHGRRADGIVRGMLMHSRGGKREREPADLNLLITQSTDLAYHGLRATDASIAVQVEKQLDPEVGVVPLVAEEIGRVLLNLVNNACYSVCRKRARLGSAFVPSLMVRSRRDGNFVEIRVRDNGEGIPAAIREKLFQPFFTTKPSGSGTGLGLSISYEIVVKGHQGSIAVESTEGEFAEFVIRLPLVRA